MKTIKTFFALFLTVTAFSSCDAIDDLTEIEVNTTISKDLVITVAEGQTSFSESASISISDPDVQDNLDKIEDVKITKLTYEIISVSTADVVATGSFSVSSSSYPWFSLTDSDSVNLTAAVAAGTVYEIEVNQAIVDAFEADLKSGATANLSASGTVSASPVTFTVRVTADVEVTVDAI